LAGGAPVGHPLTAVVVASRPQGLLRNWIDPVTRHVAKNYLTCDKVGDTAVFGSIGTETIDALFGGI
jgi:hypothetical protein